VKDTAGYGLAKRPSGKAQQPGCCSMKEKTEMTGKALIEGERSMTYDMALHLQKAVLKSLQ